MKNTPDFIRDSEKEVLNYNKALENLHQLTDKSEIKLTTNLVLDTHTLVTKELLPTHEIGKFRKQPVVVNDPALRKVKYLAPDWKEVNDLIKQLVDYINNNQNVIDPLILAGIFHKQFVIIHPFLDGNGRTTRLITKFILATLGVNTFKLFSFENYYNQNISKYFDKVGLTGDYYELKNNIDFTDWLEYFTDGIIDELIRVTDQLKSTSSSPKIRLRPHEIKLLDFIKKHGFITDKDYANLTDRAKATRNQDFRRLISLKLIRMLGKGKATYYILH
ncbi:MAG: Fic family protein [Patescibacteria group bacterium]